MRPAMIDGRPCMAQHRTTNLNPKEYLALGKALQENRLWLVEKPQANSATLWTPYLYIRMWRITKDGQHKATSSNT